MKYPIYRKWRKVFTLSATFLLAVFVVIACKKKTTTIGDSGIDAAGLLAAGAVDTFSLETYTILDDSISTKNPFVNVLGEMNDPVFGKMKASFYTQIRLNAVSPSFGDINDIRMDSVILSMQFANYTGKLTPQTFEVYELNEAIDSDVSIKYYDFDTLERKPVNLVEAGMGTITPEPIADAIVDTIAVAPQMRIPLDTNFAKTLMIEAETNATTFSSNENFLNYFKGIYVTTNNAPQTTGQGGVFGMNMSNGASKITIYYKRQELVNGVLTWVKKSYDFVINGSSQSFNRAEFDRSSKITSAINNKSNGLTEFYTQVFGLRGVVSIPGLSNIPKNAIIQKAILNLPISYQSGSAYSPGSLVNFFRKEVETSNSGTFLFNTGITVSDLTKSVQKDVSDYVQDIVAGKTTNKPIYIAPFSGTTSGDRIIFNGPNTLNKVKPKLYIIYTEF